MKTKTEQRVDSLFEKKDLTPTNTGIEESILTGQADKTIVSTLGERVAPEDVAKRSEIKQRLSKAGFYSDSAYYSYMGFKILTMLIFPTIVMSACMFYFQFDFGKTLLPSLFFLGIGMFVPDVILGILGSRRLEQIFIGMPDALDLLVICIESGLGLDAAMQKVAEEFHINNPVFSEELMVTCTSIRLGKSRNDALHDLGERTGSDDLKTLAAVLVQADRFGTSVAQALRVHSEDLRTRRRQRAEEMAAKTTVKILIPLVLFIFPSIFVVAVGPAIIRIMEVLMPALERN